MCSSPRAQKQCSTHASCPWRIGPSLELLGVLIRCQRLASHRESAYRTMHMHLARHTHNTFPRFTTRGSSPEACSASPTCASYSHDEASMRSSAGGWSLSAPTSPPRRYETVRLCRCPQHVSCTLTLELVTAWMVIISLAPPLTTVSAGAADPSSSLPPKPKASMKSSAVALPPSMSTSSASNL